MHSCTILEFALDGPDLLSETCSDDGDGKGGVLGRSYSPELEPVSGVRVGRGSISIIMGLMDIEV